MSKYTVSKDPCAIESDNEDTPVPITRRSHHTQQTVHNPKILNWGPESSNPRPEEISDVPDSSDESSHSPPPPPSSPPTDSPPPLIAITNGNSSPMQPIISNPSNFDPIALLQADTNTFVNTYIPKDYPYFVQCRLKRDKEGVQGGFFPTFYLHAERQSDKKKFFMLAARKVAKVKRQSEYLITTNVETLSEKAGGDGFIGRLRGNNLVGTEYTLFDNGLSPKKSSSKHSKNGEALRRELAAIVYNTNILGLKGPRQINVMIPKTDHEVRPTKSDLGIINQWKHRVFTHLLQLRNRTPKFNEETKTYVLQFTGNRVAQPSVKNFQLIIDNENEEEEVIMQFGRVDEDTFTCDYRYPLSAIQAFGIALSSFDSRLIRE